MFCKSSKLAEALGVMDELNSLLGVVKIKINAPDSKILGQVQQNLFLIQAELAGAKKTILKPTINQIEKIIASLKKELPPIKHFIVAGGTEASALLDYARAVTRRAEREVLKIVAEQKIGPLTLVYLNRLSSLLYLLARRENHKFGIKEQGPDY